MSCGAVHRHGSDHALLWLWCRPAPTALIRPLAWETPYAVGVALKRQKKKKKKRIILCLQVRESFHLLKETKLPIEYMWKINRNYIPCPQYDNHLHSLSQASLFCSHIDSKLKLIPDLSPFQLAIF